MPRKPSPPADNPEEFKRFVDMAREVEADEAPDAVDRAFRRVISAPTERGANARAPRSPRKRPAAKTG
jgi:hypothetical protein